LCQRHFLLESPSSLTSIPTNALKYPLNTSANGPIGRKVYFKLRPGGETVRFSFAGLTADLASIFDDIKRALLGKTIYASTAA